MRQKAARILPCLFTAGAITTGLLAQDEPEDLGTFITEEVPIEENILPTSRPFSSVYGTERSILETPRNVTIISREQLDSISIKSVRDISQLTSSSFSRTNFGAPATPDIRTQIADVYFNGMRSGLTSNGNGLPLNFNSVESVNILKGPASSVYGPSQYVGGYLDLQSKRPFFDAERGEASLTVGSYGVLRASLDYSKPLSEKTAFRISYSGEDSDGYFDDSKLHSHALYGSLTYRPNENYELFLNGELFYANYVENFGINRVSQALIDDGLYPTGVNVNGGTSATAGDPQNATNSTSGFPPNVIAWEGVTKIDRNRRLLKPGDDSEGRSAYLQAIQTWKLPSGATLVNNTLGRYIRRETLSSYLYSEIVDPAISFENRTEFRDTLVDDDAMKIEYTAGLAVRYQSVEAYNDYYNEPAAVWDISKDLNGVDFTRSVNYGGNTGFSAPVPGWPGRFATAGVANDDTNDSTAKSFAPFVQGSAKFSDMFVVDAGLRRDFLSVDYRDPITEFRDDVSVEQDSYNFSASYLASEVLSFYGTYNFSENPAGAAGNGGGFTGLNEDEDGNMFLDPGNYKTEAELLEFGVKLSLLEGKLFIGGSTFEQDRFDTDTFGNVSEFNTKGTELEMNYQPSSKFFMTAAVSFFDATTTSPQFYVTTNTTRLDPATGAVVPVVTFGEYLGQWLDAGAPEIDVQGVPDMAANLLLNYKFESGLALTGGVVYTSEMRQNSRGDFVIPSQYTVNASASYDLENWSLRLQIFNLTDEENWSPPNVVYGDESIYADEPIRAEFTVSTKF